MGVVEDVERLFDLVGLAHWRCSFNEAVGRADEEACENLHIALIVLERTELRPPGRLFTLEEVAAEFGIDLPQLRNDAQ